VSGSDFWFNSEAVTTTTTKTITKNSGIGGESHYQPATKPAQLLISQSHQEMQAHQA